VAPLDRQVGLPIHFGGLLWGATFSPNSCKSRLADTDFPFNKVVDSFSLAKDAIGCLIIKTHCGLFSLAKGAIGCLIIKTHCGLFLLAEDAIGV